MRTVWKYTLHVIYAPQPMMIPYDSMSSQGPWVATQNDHICVWAEVDTEKEPQEKIFHVRGTGQPTPDGASYLGSALQHGGQLVWHVFVNE